MAKCLSFDQLRDVNKQRTAVWTGAPDYSQAPVYTAELLFRSNKVGGECGEIQEAVKRLARFKMNMAAGGKPPEEAIPLIADELADVIISVDRLAELLGIDLSIAVANKFNSTSDKYGFDIKFPE